MHWVRKNKHIIQKGLEELAETGWNSMHAMTVVTIFA